MGYQIIERINLNSSNVSIKVFAPLVALKAQAGQFVILRPFSDSERLFLRPSAKLPPNLIRFASATRFATCADRSVTLRSWARGIPSLSAGVWVRLSLCRLQKP